VGVVFRGDHERAGWCIGRRREGDREKRRAEKAGPENGGKLPLAIRTRQRPTHKKPPTDLSSETSEINYERRELKEDE
jgi:hypothetical protein